MTVSITERPKDDERAVVCEITRQDRRIAAYAASAVLLSLLDLSIPLPLPGVKPGLANIVALIALTRLGWRAACWVTLLRVLIVSLLVGVFLSPGFWLSLTGAAAALAALGASVFLPSSLFGPVSQSVLAAIAHMAAQIAVVDFWLFPVFDAPALLALFLGFALATGVVNGLIAARTLSKTALSDNPHEAA